jgi:hypothetical protein
MLNNSEDGSAKTNLCACNTTFLHDINFSGVKDEHYIVRKFAPHSFFLLLSLEEPHLKHSDLKALRPFSAFPLEL